MIGNLVSMLVWGLIAGVVARALLPGDDSMTWWQTALLGIVGSFVGGTLGVLFTGRNFSNFETSGVIGSIIGAVIALIAGKHQAENPYGRWLPMGNKAIDDAWQMAVHDIVGGLGQNRLFLG